MLEINWEFVIAENKGSVDTSEEHGSSFAIQKNRCFTYRVQTPSGVFTKKLTVIIRLTV